MAEEPRKRSRFDQTEADVEPARKSRFDRRSRSPARDDAAAGRSRSPVVAKSIESPGSSAKKDAAAAAAAAAARINEQINAKKNLQKVDVPSIMTSNSPSAGAGAAKSPSQGAAPLNDEIYQQDGDFIKDIEVNDLRNRYTLTKGSTQKMIKEKTGADVTTRGNYYPDKSMATPASPPLYLHVTSTTKDGLEKAVKEIEELMKQELPNLIDERRFRRREPEQQVERDSMGRRKWPEERIPIDLEPIPGFNLRAQVVGTGGSYVKHIQQETRCRVQIKGRGSGFLEHDTHQESDEQMYLHVAGPDSDQVQAAKDLCLGLLDSVRASYEAFKERGPRGGGGGGGDRGGGFDDHRGGYHQRDRNGGSYGGHNQQYGYNQQNYGGGAQSPPSVQTPVQQEQQQQAYMDPQQINAWIQYYMQYPDQDPYGAYGGYAAMMAPYLNPSQPGIPGQPQQHGYAGSPTQQNGAGIPPPPPPPGDVGDDQPPPPPPPPPGA